MHRIRALGATIAVMLMLLACTSVDSTEHCFETRYGKIISEHMSPGLNATFFTDATCFDMTEQNWPGEGGDKEIVAGTTLDRLNVSTDLALTWEYDPSTISQVFRDKRNPARVQSELLNAVRDGARATLASWTVDDLLGPRRAELGEAMAAAINRKLGGIARVKKVYVRGIGIPEQITQQQLAKIAAIRERETAMEKFKADSVTAFNRQYQAQVDANIKDLQAQVYSENPALLQLEIAKTYAAGMQGVCKGTSTCILGGNVADKWLSGVR